MWSLFAARDCAKRRRWVQSKAAMAAARRHSAGKVSATAPNDKNDVVALRRGHRQRRGGGPGQQPRSDGSHDTRHAEAQELRAGNLSHPPLSSYIGSS